MVGACALGATGDRDRAPIKEETVDAVTLIPREQIQQRAPEQIEDVPQSLEETVGAVDLVLREQIQQRTAEQMVKLPQSPGETVDAVTLVPRERVQQQANGGVAPVSRRETVDAPSSLRICLNIQKRPSKR